MAACGGERNNGQPANPLSPSAPAPVAPTPVGPDATIVAAGDVGVCGRAEVESTARLLDGIMGPILALGDLAYPAGTASDFASCYDPSWGRYRGRTRPTPGNHEYETSEAKPYYEYFGPNAGPAGRGYYSYRAGDWLVVSLNSNVAADAGSSQAVWLQSTLTAEPAKCTLAYWHHPVFSSGEHGNNGKMRALWQILQQAGAEVVLVGHDHLYERFAPQNADGQSDPAGLRQFTVGTGGAQPYGIRALARNSEMVGQDEGVLRLTLKSDSYAWQFMPIAGRRFSDAGSATCR
jgi:3',5'-cyclic AMP phosphodiesterase CpdA